MNDIEGFSQLVARFKGTVFRVAYGYLRNRPDAEDVTQEVLLKLYRSSREFEDLDHVKRWLIRVTVNECTSLYRALRRRPENIDDYLDTLVAPTPRHAELLHQVLALPTRYRTVLYLYYYEGYATREVAELIGVPESTVRTRLARGRHRLKDALEESDAP